MAYRAIYMPPSMMRPDVVFVSAAKLKTHGAAA
jgi:hypothetical protein